VNDPITRAKAFRARCKSPDNLDTSRDKLDQAMRIIDELVAVAEAPTPASKDVQLVWNSELSRYQQLTRKLPQVTTEPEAMDIARRVGIADIKPTVREVPQFKVGDRVRYTGSVYFAGQVNKDGNVVDISIGWVTVHFDEPSEFDLYIIRPGELQLQQAQKSRKFHCGGTVGINSDEIPTILSHGHEAPKFKYGDRVVCVNQNSRFYADAGTIQFQDLSNPTLFAVQMDSDKHIGWPMLHAEELEHIKP